MAAAVRLADTHVPEPPRQMPRAPVPADVDGHADVMASDRGAFVGAPVPRAKAWRRFGHHAGHRALRGHGTFFLRPRDGGPSVGMVMARQPEGHPRREVGRCLFAEAAARAVPAHVLPDLGRDTAVSCINPANAASIRLAERLGARLDADAEQADPEHPGLFCRHPREVRL